MKIRNGFVSNSSSSSFIIMINNRRREPLKGTACLLDKNMVRRAKGQNLDTKKLRELSTYKFGIDMHKENVEMLEGKFHTLTYFVEPDKQHYDNGERWCTYSSSENGSITSYTQGLIQVALMKDKIDQKYHAEFDKKLAQITKASDKSKLVNGLYNKSKKEKLCAKAADWYYKKLLNSNNDSHFVCFTWASDCGSAEEAFLRRNSDEILQYDTYIEWNNS